MRISDWSSVVCSSDLFDAAGLRPEQLRDAADLARLPVFKKEAMIEQQRLAPPYGGFLAAAPAEIERIFVSPGPINEPQFRGEVDGLGFGAAFAAAGIDSSDVVLNTWSYHLVPAGLLQIGRASCRERVCQ